MLSCFSNPFNLFSIISSAGCDHSACVCLDVCDKTNWYCCVINLVEEIRNEKRSHNNIYNRIVKHGKCSRLRVTKTYRTDRKTVFSLFRSRTRLFIFVRCCGDCLLSLFPFKSVWHSMAYICVKLNIERNEALTLVLARYKTAGCAHSISIVPWKLFFHTMTRFSRLTNIYCLLLWFFHTISSNAILVQLSTIKHNGPAKTTVVACRAKRQHSKFQIGIFGPHYYRNDATYQKTRFK